MDNPILYRYIIMYKACYTAHHLLNFVPYNLWVNSLSGTDAGKKDNLFEITTLDPCNKLSAVFMLGTLQ